MSFQLKITETKNKILPALHTIQDGGCGQWAKVMESPGIDPGASRMLSERSTIWASLPMFGNVSKVFQFFFGWPTRSRPLWWHFRCQFRSIFAPQTSRLADHHFQLGPILASRPWKVGIKCVRREAGKGNRSKSPCSVIKCREHRPCEDWNCKDRRVDTACSCRNWLYCGQ